MNIYLFSFRLIIKKINYILIVFVKCLVSIEFGFIIWNYVIFVWIKRVSWCGCYEY